MPALAGLALGALVLASCGFADRALVPALTGEDPAGPAARAVPKDPPIATAVAAADPSPTGRRLRELRTDLQRLQNNLGQRTQEFTDIRLGVGQSNAQYQSLVGALEASRRPGAAPDGSASGQWAQAQAQLARIGESVPRLNALSTAANTDATLASYVTQSVAAAAQQGGLSESQRRMLGQLDGDAARTAIAIDRLLEEIGGEIATQSRVVGTERQRLAGLAGSLGIGGRAVGVVAAPAVPTERPPLIVIRFDRSTVAFEQELYSAVSQAVQRKPDAALDLVAIAPPGGAPGENALASKRNIEAVVKALADMGFPGERVSLSAITRPTALVNEVRVFVR